MHITISRHAAQRAIERGITEEGIRAIAGGGVLAVTIINDQKPNVNITIGLYENKHWAILVDNNTDNVITVRRARKKEIKLYEKVYDDR